MPKMERTHEVVSGLPSLEYLVRRTQEGWKLAGLEWEREAAGAEPGAPASEPREWVEEIPYGLRVSDDCSRLVESPAELEIVTIALDMIVEDCPLSRVADELNLRGYRTRQGQAWTPSALFNLLPRMIQVGPRLFTSEQWVARRKRLPKVV
jgi:Recombinase